MYLGFFFIHWSSDETKQVFQSEPTPIEECPFCKQSSTIIYKIYNSKTKHYSAFSIGEGDYSATFTCRNCTQEGQLGKTFESELIHEYKLILSHEKLLELYKHEPEKARNNLKKLIRKNQEVPIIESFKETLNTWNRELSSPKD